MERNRPPHGPSVSDRGPDWDSVMGVSGAAVVVAAAGTNPATGVPPAGMRIVITDIIASSDAAQTISIIEETTGTILLRFYVGAASSLQITPRGKIKTATAGKRAQIVTGGAGNASCTLLYYYEA